MVLRFFLFGSVFFFASCTDVERDDPDDPKSKYYRGSGLPSSSSAVAYSSSKVVSSSSVATQSSSSVVLSSSSAVVSSSSVGVPSSLSFLPSSSSYVAVSSSSVAVPSSSSSVVLSSSSVALSSSSKAVSSSSAVVPSSSSSLVQPNVVYGTPVSYEGETYQTVVIGTQAWMARNLNYNATGSKCYDDDPANCDIYGRLYDWTTAMALPSDCSSNSCSLQINAKRKGICPTGWHIPSDAEWTTLTDFLGPVAGSELKATNGWSYNGQSGNGTDAYSFSALPGGCGYSSGNFRYVGSNGLWWSATENATTYAWFRKIYYGYASMDRNYESKKVLYSVRCAQD
jgi:uncharacterized protein (TIGR02145 family)